MLEKDSEWILPGNLRKQELKSRKLVDEGSSDYGGDFGAYYAYRKGINFDFIKSHAYTDDHKALAYAKNLRTFLNSVNLKLEGEILDVGCAIGTITNSIDLLSNKGERGGKTYGIDLSEDGIEVAKYKFPNCTFYQQSADELDNFENGYFDIIHCREFYPFTRTNDKQYHMKYLNLFLKKLKPLGFVILEMCALDKGFCHTYIGLDNQLKNVGYSVVKRYIEVPVKLYRIFGTLSYKRPLYELLKLVTLSILRQRVSFFYILAK